VAAESEHALTDLRAKNAGYARRVEELENRVLILEDQLESRRAAIRGPARPTIRIVEARPPEPVEVISTIPARTFPPRSKAGAQARLERLGSPSGGGDDGGSSVLAEQDVEYGGDALSTSGPAPGGGRRNAHLHLSGSGRGVHLRVSLAAAEGKTEEGKTEGGKKKSSRLYRRALAAMRAGDYEPAVAGFRKFIESHPRHKLADNAQYWIGECFYDRRDFPAAEPEYRQVIEKFPRSKLVPDAMLKLGFALLGEGEKDSGRKVLESLTHGYPEHKVSRLATARLGQPEEAPSRTQTRVLGTIVTPVMTATTEGPRRSDAP
jgi:tol-pal system protein YbgF